MKDLVIIGAGGFGREVAWLIDEINHNQKQWNLLGFLDENPSLHGQELNGYPVLGGLGWLRGKGVSCVVAIGEPVAKKNVIQSLINDQISFATLIHPDVHPSSSVTFGEGCIVCAGTILTVNVEIGNHVILNLGCTIGHDVSIGDYATILPGVNVSGAVVISEEVSVGTGSAIIQGVTIGTGTIVGAGAVVTRSLPAHCTAVGSPAKPIKFHHHDGHEAF